MKAVQNRSIAPKHALAALALSAVAASAGAQPQVVNEINVHRDWYDRAITVQAGDQGSTAGVVVTTVPEDVHLIVTDVVMTHNVNTTTGTFRANIRRGPASNQLACDRAGLVLGPYVSPDETVSINLSTGIEFGPGEQICVAIGGAGSSEGVTMTFTGYFTDPRTGP